MPTPPPKRPVPPQKPQQAVKSISSGKSPFDDLVEETPRHGHFIMFYSEAGEGKTTLAAQFPDPMFIVTSGEQGINLYKQNNVVTNIPVVPLEPLFEHSLIPAGGHPGWIKCLKTMERFADAEHQYKTLVIDSVSGLQDLCFQHGASMLFNGDMDGKDFCDYYRGYTKSAECFWAGQFIPACLQIVAKGYNVILIAHSTYKPVPNPTGPDFDQHRPALYKTIFEYTKKDLHGMFYLGREINVTIESKTKKKTATGDRRFIGVSPSTWYVAKSWCTQEGVTEIECGSTAKETYGELQKALMSR